MTSAEFSSAVSVEHESTDKASHIFYQMVAMLLAFVFARAIGEV